MYILIFYYFSDKSFVLSAVREIKFLKSLQHKNIVQLKDVISSKGCENLEVPILPKAETVNNDQAIGENAEKEISIDENIDSQQEDVNETSKRRKSNAKAPFEPSKVCGNLYLVFEYVEHDLGGLIDAKHKFSEKAIKTIVKQLFEVLEFLCERKVLHRDIKCSNILISNRHQIKLADFGLARSAISSDGREFKTDMTNNVITMWYKPPELVGIFQSIINNHKINKNVFKIFRKKF